MTSRYFWWSWDNLCALNELEVVFQLFFELGNGRCNNGRLPAGRPFLLFIVDTDDVELLAQDLAEKIILKIFLNGYLN